jgi:hypothetical protein
LIFIKLRSQAFLTQFYLSILSYFQHHEGIYWCPASLCNEEERSYKVRDAADVQAVPQPPIEEYISDSLVGSDNEATASRRALPKVTTSAPRHPRLATGKISASRAAAAT